MSKKEQYADNVYSPQEYVFAWLIGGGSLNESTKFEGWVRSIKIDGMELSRIYIRKIIGEFYRCNINGTNNLALAALDYRYNKLKSGIRSNIELRNFSEEFDKNHNKGDN